MRCARGGEKSPAATGPRPGARRCDARSSLSGIRSGECALILLTAGLLLAQVFANLSANKAAASRRRDAAGEPVSPSAGQHRVALRFLCAAPVRGGRARAGRARFSPAGGAQLSAQRAAAARGRRHSAVQRPRRRVSWPILLKRRARSAQIARRSPDAAPADCARRPRLLLRAAQAGAARLHGAEGHRNGRGTSPAGHHPPHPGPPRQFSAAARQCGGGGRAMRRAQRARGRRRPSIWTIFSPPFRRNGSSFSATRMRRVH